MKTIFYLLKSFLVTQTIIIYYMNTFDATFFVFYQT